MRKLAWWMAVAGLCFAVSACGDSGRGGRGGDHDGGGGLDGGPGGGDGSTDGGGDGEIGPRVDLATISGQVWAPGNAPDMVPSGEEIPVFDALVRVVKERPEAIPQMAYCERCVDVSGLSTRSDHEGNFTLGNIPPGDWWVVIEKGQFRLERQITLTEGEERPLAGELTTLPSVHDPSSGDWVPKMAIATGAYDSLEDVLGKMSIGGVDASGAYEVGPGSEQIDFYENGGESFSGSMGSLSSLVNDLGKMKQYHIIFIPCGSDSNTSALQNETVLNNIREYVKAGGKLYVTDWSGEWMDNVFPAFVELDSSVDTPASAYDPDTNTWDTSQFGDADGSAYTSPNGEADDEDLFTWLDAQSGPYAESGSGPFDAGDFTVVGSWNTIYDRPNITIGTDDEGLPVEERAKAWVIGGKETEPTPKRPLTVTFEPAGCGRVLYSVYHTTETSHVGLVPQERVLLYLIMEIGVCKEGPVLI
ncbi:MAG: carboxypeptidase-like regulatory domain-containing protein [Polyangiales bacterium]